MSGVLRKISTPSVFYKKRKKRKIKRKHVCTIKNSAKFQ